MTDRYFDGKQPAFSVGAIKIDFPQTGASFAVWIAWAYIGQHVKTGKRRLKLEKVIHEFRTKQGLSWRVK